jgi:YHS domain-containing protein
MQCNESFSTRHTFESAIYDEGIYYFCSKECMDMWMSVNAQEIELENQQKTSRISCQPFLCDRQKYFFVLALFMELAPIS